jgi:hypothetical protein
MESCVCRWRYRNWYEFELLVRMIAGDVCPAVYLVASAIVCYLRHYRNGQAYSIDASDVSIKVVKSV